MLLKFLNLQLLLYFLNLSGTIGLYFKRDSNKALLSFLDQLSRLKVNVNISLIKIKVIQIIFINIQEEMKNIMNLKQIILKIIKIMKI